MKGEIVVILHTQQDLLILFYAECLACVSVHHWNVSCLQLIEEASEPLELELWTIVSHHVMRTKATGAFSALNHFSSYYQMLSLIAIIIHNHQNDILPLLYYIYYIICYIILDHYFQYIPIPYTYTKLFNKTLHFLISSSHS